MKRFRQKSPRSPSSSGCPSCLLSSLPTEIIEQIYSYLSPRDLTSLARINRSLYASVQSPLYRHANVTSFQKLTLFVRSLNSVAFYDKSGEGAESKNVVSLRIAVDPNATELATRTRPTSIMLSRFIEAIVRYCPRVSITLHLQKSSCNEQPLSSFDINTFPRVTRIIFELGHASVTTLSGSRSGPPGSSSTNQIIPVRRGLAPRPPLGSRVGCSANPLFWTRIFNATSFPDLREAVIIHKRVATPSSWVDEVRFGPDDLKALGQVTSLVIDSAPELNDAVLQGALTRAESLKRLELRNIHGLSYDGLSMLLPHALPNLEHFTLHIPYQHRSATVCRNQLEMYQPLAPTGESNPLPVHLCPLFRRFGKNLRYLDIQAPFLCRDLFLDEKEKSKLSEAGIKTGLGNDAGGWCLSANGDPYRVDRIAEEQTIKQLRKQRDDKALKDAVKVNLAKKLEKGIINNVNSAAAVSTAEYEEEQKRLQRARTISKQGWRRILKIGAGMCRDGETWEEFCLLAGLEEAGVDWFCASDALKVGTSYRGGVEIPIFHTAGGF